MKKELQTIPEAVNRLLLEILNDGEKCQLEYVPKENELKVFTVSTKRVKMGN